MKDIALELTKTLGSYNKTVNKTVNGMNKSLMAIGFILVSSMFLVEMMSWYRFIRNQGGEMTWKLFAEVAFKYFIAYFLVAESGAILNAILWFTNGVTKMVGGVVSDNLFEYTLAKKGTWGIRIVVNALAYIFGATAILSVKALVLLRFIELYLLKAIAPIIVAFWMSDQTRSIATNLLKTFGAIALQGVIIIIILVIWQGFTMDTLIKADSNSWLGNFAAGFSYIGKCIVFIILLFGSQRKAKSLLQTT